ncbi:uncharacterized protein LOC118233646 isoform X2 [Anguilla anguilla]|uniref:uncharacterized protein LOC118233646 isoform X2 n=1 Tax=Anguilla anguilla TaxID=7936 RepID=UPI0015AEF4C7|nr:uncharacterized protein LOC118233646 isoform X2 [Anguilla anguilla]
MVLEELQKLRECTAIAVPRSTLADRVKGRVSHGVTGGPRPILSKSDELSVVRYCQYMASHGHPLSRSQCVAFGTSIRRERDPQAKPLSRTWWRNFRRRHRAELTMRTPNIIDRVTETQPLPSSSGEPALARPMTPPTDSTSLNWGESLSRCCGCGKAEPPGEDGMVVSWVACKSCERWFHSKCVGWHEEEEEQDKKFLCFCCPES